MSGKKSRNNLKHSIENEIKETSGAFNKMEPKIKLIKRNKAWKIEIIKSSVSFKFPAEDNEGGFRQHLGRKN